jgi:hypothetical protein
MDLWMDFELAERGGKADAYTTIPNELGPLPPHVACDHPFVIACRRAGVPVYPVFEDGAK